jgi:outer membrane protein assembly factor BamB
MCVLVDESVQLRKPLQRIAFLTTASKHFKQRRAITHRTIFHSFIVCPLGHAGQPSFGERRERRTTAPHFRVAARCSPRYYPFTMRTPALLFLAILLNIQAGDWPQWRGPNRDGHAAPDQSISPAAFQNPVAKWKIQIGGGFSSPIVFKNKLVYLDEQDAKEVAHCLDAATGKEIWKVPYADFYEDEWGRGPRATPFTDGQKLFIQSCNGEFRCLDFSTGKTLWRFNFENYGVKFLGSKANEGTASRRGNNGAGILDGDAVIVPVGGSEGKSLVCLNKDNGELIWKSGDDEAAYSSLMVANIAGARQVIAFTAEALLGAERSTGKILWRVPLKTNAKRHAMTPIIHGNDIFVNSHTFGLICFEISPEGKDFKAVEKWRNRDMKINLATPVLAEGYLYSHGPAKNFVCVDAETGKLKWIQDGFGKEYSSTLLAGDKLAIITDSGEFSLIEANPSAYKQLARVQICGKNWNHPALSDGFLYVRDSRELACYPAKQL